MTVEFCEGECGKSEMKIDQEKMANEGVVSIKRECKCCGGVFAMSTVSFVCLNGEEITRDLPILVTTCECLPNCQD